MAQQLSVSDVSVILGALWMPPRQQQQQQ